MKIDLFVYTGTGNSLWVARQLARELKETDLCLCPPENNRGREITLQFIPWLSKDIEVKAEGIGIIFPVHIWGLPARIVQFINHLRVGPKTYIFALSVNAGQPAATLLQLRKLVSSRQGALALGYSIVMPSNYIPWGGPGPDERLQQLFQDARKKVKAVSGAILREERGEVERGPLWQNILFSSIYKMSFRSVRKMDKKFRVDDRCNHCGICSKVCPAANIEMIRGKPSWLHRCEQCLACLQWCPQEAIQYGKKTVKTPRYHHPEVGLEEMLRQAAAEKT